jgi:hypothetical protein
MPEKPPIIARSEIVDALHRSGYLIEHRVEAVLREQGYHVAANTSYPDPVTRKLRELDVSATGGYPVGSNKKDFLFDMLLIECVNNPQPLAFFMKEAQAKFIHVYDIILSGLPAYIPGKGSNKNNVVNRIASFLNLEDFHHYCEGQIATQYCSFSPKRGTNPTEWMASHDEAHFESFGKLCAAVNHDIENHYANTIPVINDRINLQIYYPILVVGGQMIGIESGGVGDEVQIKEADHIHYIQSYLLQGKQIDYHIDVVTEKYLPRLICAIHKETREIIKRLKKNKAALYKAIDKMAKWVSSDPSALQEIIRPHQH